MTAQNDRALLLQQFRMVLQTVKSHFAQVERETGIGGSKVWALSLVKAQPGIGVGELARTMCVRQPTASQMVKHLQLQGLLETRPHPKDGRALQLYLTTAGQDLLEKAPVPYAGVLPQAIDQLDEETVRRMRRDLHTLAGIMGASAASANMPLDRL